MRRIEEKNGKHFQVEIRNDNFSGKPWDNMSTLGTVSEWTTRDKMPSELVLNVDRNFRRYYDYAAAVSKGREEGMTGEQASKAAKAEFDYFRDWCNDGWNYIGVVVTLLHNDGMPSALSNSLWGIESNATEYIEEIIQELIEEMQ